MYTLPPPPPTPDCYHRPLREFVPRQPATRTDRVERRVSGLANGGWGLKAGRVNEFPRLFVVSVSVPREGLGLSPTRGETDGRQGALRHLGLAYRNYSAVTIFSGLLSSKFTFNANAVVMVYTSLSYGRPSAYS